MSPSGRHPHIDRASTAQLAELNQHHNPELCQIFLNVHQLILEIYPDVNYSTDCTDGGTGYGIRQYGYDGWGMMGLNAYAKWVSVTFLHGSKIEDSLGLLVGTGGGKMRTVKLRSLDEYELYKGELRRFIETAAQV